MLLGMTFAMKQTTDYHGHCGATTSAYLKYGKGEQMEAFLIFITPSLMALLPCIFALMDM